MAQASIPVDLHNPGQVFACLGLAECADVLLGEADAAFEWNQNSTSRFRLRAACSGDPIGTVLDFLAHATVVSIAPVGSELSTSKWGVPTEETSSDEPFPFAVPTSPATLPALLRSESGSIAVEHWGASTAARDNVKFWAGSGGYPGAALMRDALELIRDCPGGVAEDPFSFSKPQSSSFRFDWRRDYIPIDAGFSPNEHAGMVMVGYPFVEILASIGLTNARPYRVAKLEYRYGALGCEDEGKWYPLLFHRAALGCAELPFTQRFFRMQLGWPGQAGQARCIKTVTEETSIWLQH